MRSPQEIELEIDLVKHGVKYARQEQDHREEELLLAELDALREELYQAKTMFNFGEHT
jgi:hypothetical protein